MQKVKPINIRTTFVTLALCWSIIMLVAMSLDMYDTDKSVMAMARIQARSAIAKDLLYRRWNAENGGVYGTLSKTTPPNRFLKAVDREISTPSGRQLTLINPSYMTRQVHALELQQKEGLRSHITSLNPIRPGNAADAWEQTALRRFEQGETEVSGLKEINGRQYLRVMRPLLITAPCLKCHAGQGYKPGDIRGGLSASVPMKEWNILKRQHLAQGYLLYLTFWLVGLLGLGGAMYQLRRQIRRNEAVSEELGQFKATLDGINDAVLMLDPGTLCFFYVNHVVTKSSGYSEKELLHMAPSDLFPDLDREHCRELIHILLSGDKEYFQFEGTIQHKNGTVIPVDVHLQFIEPTGGQGRIVAVLRNISKQKAIERERQQMKQRLMQAQKLESVGRLAAGIAHEINTPVQFVSSNMDFMTEAFHDLGDLIQRIRDIRKELPGEVADTINKALEDADWEYLVQELPVALKQSGDGLKRISSIVQAMKDFSRPSGMEKVAQSLNQIIETTVTVAANEWKPVADLEMDLDPELPDIPLLADQMGQVFLNILINAAHAVHEKLGDNPDGAKGTITLTTGIVDDMVEITVRDTGTGIPEESREKIFDPFYTTREVGRGAGQGLAIARDVVVNKHGGTIEVESIEGQGTTVLLRLPI